MSKYKELMTQYNELRRNYRRFFLYIQPFIGQKDFNERHLRELLSTYNFDVDLYYSEETGILVFVSNYVNFEDINSEFNRDLLLELVAKYGSLVTEQDEFNELLDILELR